MQSQEEELNRAKADLGRLQQEENQLEQSLAAGKIQLETIIKSLKATQDEINQVRLTGFTRGHCCSATAVRHSRAQVDGDWLKAKSQRTVS